MIDEKKLIECLAYDMSCFETDDKEISQLYVRVDDMVRMINSQPKIGGWIPCSERLPENAGHKGAFCPKYRVMTKYGQTIGWYNPDFESWFILIWFMTERFLEEEIDFKRGDIPKVVKCPMELEIVTAWCEPLEVYDG